MRVILAMMLGIAAGCLIGSGKPNFGLIVGTVAWMLLLPEMVGDS